MKDAQPPLAHSPPRDSESGDPYVRHVEAVRHGAHERAEAMLRYSRHVPQGLLEAIVAAATFHDLGKLDCNTQEVLHKGRSHRLRWDHIDAGVAIYQQSTIGWRHGWFGRTINPACRKSRSTSIRIIWDDDCAAGAVMMKTHDAMRSRYLEPTHALKNTWRHMMRLLAKQRFCRNGPRTG